ncbi:MAG: hypothetical protein FWF83_06910 [Clostridiales bacterium]|nr:hypothetical protein [Clostridiales bacterium]
MKRQTLAICIASLSISAIIISCFVMQSTGHIPGASFSTPVKMVEWTDFIKWDDTSYISSWSPLSVPEDLIEDKIGEVKQTAPSTVRGEYEPTNGTAGYLKQGTILYSIRGYDQDHYIAAGIHRGYRLYKTRDSETPDFPAEETVLDMIISGGNATVSEPIPMDQLDLEQQSEGKANRPSDSPDVSVSIVEISGPFPITK